MPGVQKHFTRYVRTSPMLVTLRVYLSQSGLMPQKKYGLSHYHPDETRLVQKLFSAKVSALQLLRFESRQGYSVFLLKKPEESRLISEEDWDWELADSRDLQEFLPVARRWTYTPRM